MADNATRQPNLNLTQDEKRTFYQLFQSADTTNLGVITGEIAVPFFEKTKLAPETLGLIWQIADRENRGLLTPSGFSIVMRLIGHAQAGRQPTDELALQPGPLPRFDGGLVVDTTSSAPHDAGATSPPPSAGGPIRVPPLNPEDVNKFTSLFEKSDVSRSGVLAGETAKQIFERARLPNEILGRIWNLADTRQQGALDTTEFIIAMHLLTSYKSGAMRGIPQTLPPGFYEAASRRGPARASVGSRPGALEVPPVPTIPKQFSGPQQRTQSPVNRQQFSPLSAQGTGGDWLVTPQEKVHYDGIFETVDTAKMGILSGDQAVSFFMNANLAEETLAQIWDLADIDADGQLTKDEFAVAMYLVRQQRTGKNQVPQVLPPALIPPSMRHLAGGHVPSAPVPAAAPVPAPAPAPMPRSAADDLFGLDSPAPAQPAAPSQVPQSTGSSATPFHTPASPSRASPTPPTTFKPFIPSSTFGQSLQPQTTGTPPTVRSPPPPSDDLLGDNDPEETKKLTNDTTDLANLSNQIGSLANEMQNVQSKRTSAEQNLSQTSQQKRDFEARLAQARTMYEQEVKNFKALEERLNTSKAETQRLQQEFALIDGSRQDLQNQYEQVSAALTADQQENASLKERIRQANASVAQLKPALEKARSDARQQKGLVAINKKQLATVEGERDKIQEEMDSTSRELPPTEADESAVLAGGAAALASPAASTASQNTNPFFRRTATGSSDHAVSPPASNEQQRAFDSLFGPSVASPSAATPPPATSFGADSPSVYSSAPVKSPATSGVPTPSGSPPPSTPGVVSEPPPPAVSRQLTPSHLPFGDAHSMTSSTKVSPPGSRFGGPDTTGFGTPAQAPTSAGPIGGAAAGATSPFDELQEPQTRFPDITTEHADGEDADEAKPSQSKEQSFDELFGNIARQRSPSQKANDFDQAFAAMKQAPGKAAETPQAGASSGGGGGGEFPPIREFDADDDDDDSSDEDEAPMGFDDDFTPVAPAHPPKEPVSQGGSLDTTQVVAAAVPSPGPSEQPPALDAQKSPPGYNESISSPKPGDVPPEFHDLVPSRSDPTAAPDAPHSIESATGAPVINGHPQRDSIDDSVDKGKAPVGENKTGGTDFDAAFANLDLAPAKEAEDDDEEDSEDSEDDGPDHKHAGDFDFSFDSPPQQKTLSPHATGGTPGAGATAASDFFNFDSNVSASPSGATADAAAATSAAAGHSTASPADPSTKPAEHDWEALFAPLDNVTSPEGATPAGTANGAAGTRGDKSKEPGWALKGDNDNDDDLILKRLTGMGFPREESLAALEKFDYNIDKAADYLTSKT